MGASTWEEIRRRLARVPDPRPEPDPGVFRRAAVLVPLYEADGEVMVLLTRRTDTVEHHKGQISFPGGAADAGEDLRQTALRETFEEVGIPPDTVEILGVLPEVEVTVSNFRVTPFVGVIPHPYALIPSPSEIEELVRVPLAVLRDPANLRVEWRDREGRRYQVFLYDHSGFTIWGATARIIKDFVDILNHPEAGAGPVLE